VKLRELAHARSGDKGDVANVGVVANDPEAYAVIEEHVTAERVAAHFEDFCDGPVERYALENVQAFNFVLYDALDGGGMRSLRVDALGKCLSGAILKLEVYPDAD
jgi:hypothetical protein